MPNLREAYLRHALYYLDYVRQHRSDFASLNSELANILQGVDTCLEQENWQPLTEFIRTLSDYWVKQGFWDIYRRCTYILLDKNILQEARERGEVLRQLAEVEEAQGHYADARMLYQQQVQIFDQSESKDSDALIEALRKATELAMQQEDYGEARLFLERWLGIAQEHQDNKEQVDILIELATLDRRTGNLSEASTLLQKGLEIARPMGYTVGVIDILRHQASIHYTQQTFREARRLYQTALHIALGVNDHTRVGELRKQLVSLEETMGRNIFISYSHHDRVFVEDLARDLKNTGLAVWWDEWEIKVGDSIIEKVSEGILGSAYLAVVLSPHSVQSHWVQREMGSALMKQLSTERRITILPLLISDCEVPPLLWEIKWADFRRDYQIGIRKLLDTILEDKD